MYICSHFFALNIVVCTMFFNVKLSLPSSIPPFPLSLSPRYTELSATSTKGFSASRVCDGGDQQDKV